MRKRRRLSALSVLGGTVLLMVAASAAPASAEVIQGPCTGSATFDNGVTVTEATPLSQVVVIPPEGDVDYSGDTHLPPTDEEEPFSGSASIETALGVRAPIVNWPEPPGETKLTQSSGTYTYEAPAWVPRGTGAIKVTATHTQRGQVCTAAFNVALEGDPGTQAAVAVGLTAVAGAATLAAGTKRKGK
ncbi:MAG: hypothetical protein M5U23_01080 [Acidimicrobiia bacterium]|nr:hypothetical protein [Acidimicrobiia bacterium]